jgi:hypothetical protein
MGVYSTSYSKRVSTTMLTYSGRIIRQQRKPTPNLIPHHRARISRIPNEPNTIPAGRQALQTRPNSMVYLTAHAAMLRLRARICLKKHHNPRPQREFLKRRQTLQYFLAAPDVVCIHRNAHAAQHGAHVEAMRVQVLGDDPEEQIVGVPEVEADILQSQLVEHFSVHVGPGEGGVEAVLQRGVAVCELDAVSWAGVEGGVSREDEGGVDCDSELGWQLLVDLFTNRAALTLGFV